MDHRLRRRPDPEPEPAAIDITWVSCRGVRSSLPFHTPCLYASVCVTSSACKNVLQGRVKTPVDRAGGENPEWDERLRLYFPDDPSSPASAGNNKEDVRADEHVVRFELKAEVAVLGDVLAASAVVPLSDLVGDGRTRRVSYQLAASADGRQHNGVISFSYAFVQAGPGISNDVEHRKSKGEPVTPPCPAVSLLASVPSGTMYPVIDWPSIEPLGTLYPPLTEQVAVYPPLTADTATRSKYYYNASTPPEAAAAIYPPLTREMSARGIYPTLGGADNGLYPRVDLDPVICYPPTTVPCYGAAFGYPPVPHCDARCLYS